MIIRRWQAVVTPELKQIRQMFFLEGLKPKLEEMKEGEEFPLRKAPFDEVRIVVSGELILNVAGNQVLLREGDRVMIPSNTKHTLKAHKGKVTSLCAYKVMASH